jgi:hypothetical protein
MNPEMFAEILGGLIDRGFVLPFHFAALGSNGSVLAGSFRADETGGGLTCEIAAEHFVEKVFVAPINVMFVDARGEAARVAIGPDGEERSSN